MSTALGAIGPSVGLPMGRDLPTKSSVEPASEGSMAIHGYVPHTLRDAGGRPRRGAHEGHEGHDGDAIGIGYNKPPDVASSGRLTALLLLIPRSFFGIDRNRNPQSSTIVRCRGRDSSRRVVRSAVGGPLYCKSRMNPDFRHISTRPSPTTRSKTRGPHQHQSRILDSLSASQSRDC